MSAQEFLARSTTEKERNHHKTQTAKIKNNIYVKRDTSEISRSNKPFKEAREMPLLLHITFTALFAILGVLREVLFMLFLLRGNLGVTVSAYSAIGDGVLMCDTEKRPCTVGV